MKAVCNGTLFMDEKVTPRARLKLETARPARFHLEQSSNSGPLDQ